MSGGYGLSSPLESASTAQVEEQAVAWLRTMLLIRRFEERAEQLTMRGKVPGGVHPAVGQEATAVGFAAALAPGDTVSAPHRGHHHALAKGVSPDGLMAELYGKATGVSRGRGGSMHLAGFDVGFIGSNGIVGASVGLALGDAFAAHYRHEQRVAVAFFGDGGINTGRTWESLNLAGAWRLPLIAVCENNLYAVETPTANVTGGGSMSRRAEGFGLTALAVDGQDVFAVHQAAVEARARALAGTGPLSSNRRLIVTRGMARAKASVATATPTKWPTGSKLATPSHGAPSGSPISGCSAKGSSKSSTKRLRRPSKQLCGSPKSPRGRHLCDSAVPDAVTFL